MVETNGTLSGTTARSRWRPSEPQGLRFGNPDPANVRADAQSTLETPVVFAGLATNAIQYILDQLRDEIAGRNLDLRRLPGWVHSERIRLGWVNASLVAVVEDALVGGARESRVLGAVGADTVVLLDVPNFEATSAAMVARSGPGFVNLVGGGSPDSTSGQVSRIVMGYQGAFFDAGFAGYHGPRGMVNLWFDMKPNPELPAVASAYVPLALYIHQDDMLNLGDLWGRVSPGLMSLLVDIHDSELGEFYKTHSRPTVFTVAAGSLKGTKESGVLILGAYSPSRKAELQVVANFLRRHYSPVLLDELPGMPEMSLDQMANLWGLAARFCVMVDVEPAGHIREYGDLLRQRAIIALLRPAGSSGSTFMVGAEHLVDVNYVKLFEYAGTPTEMLPQAVEWAESVVANRIREYGSHYPWLGSTTDGPP